VEVSDGFNGEDRNFLKEAPMSPIVVSRARACRPKPNHYSSDRWRRSRSFVPPPPDLSKPVVIENLRIHHVQPSELHMAGVLESQTAQLELRRVLEHLHDWIRQKKLTSFKVDVRALNFVNSSAIRLFVDWISRAEAAGYKLVFLIERGITWHRLSFSVLQSLAPSCVEIQEGPAAAASNSRRPSVSHQHARK
jgi:hypothetical protein